MKKVKSPAEIAEHERLKKEKREYRSALTKAKNTMKKLCEDKGLRTGEAQLEYARKAHNLLPISILSAEVQIEQWVLGIKEYKENIYQD